MVKVEPPDWMRPLVTSWTAARASAKRIDPAMGAETLVLISEQHGEEPRIDVGDARRQPPAAFRSLA